MTTILVATVSMVTLGVLFGVFLAVASKIFAKDEDGRIEQIIEVLPSANCGACGYGGCRAYAQAVVGGEKVSLCTVGGQESVDATAHVMGVEADAATPMRAIVHCQGGTSQCGQRCDYEGVQDCRAAHLLSGGAKACLHGCLGFGTCADACPFEAITMSTEGLPLTDGEKCTACGICVKACPRDLISLLDVRYETYLGCSTRGKGKAVKSICSVGCIACNLCAKKDPHEAIVMDNNLPVLDHEKAEGDFAVAAEVCPMNCFVLGEGQLAAVGAEEDETEG